MTDKLKLRAESQDDLSVMSSVLQDAITRVGDMRYASKARNLTLRFTRFRHENDEKSQRIMSVLRVDGILSLKAKGIDQSDPEGLAVLLSLNFTPGDAAPGGDIHLVFAGGGEILASVECIDLTLADVSEPRVTDKTPLHPVTP